MAWVLVTGVATCDFAALSGFTQLVRGFSHCAGDILDLVMSDFPDLCKVRILWLPHWEI